MSYDEAATIPLCLATALTSLFANFPYGGGMPAPFTSEGQSAGTNKALFVIGGSSSLGQYSEPIISRN